MLWRATACGTCSARMNSTSCSAVSVRNCCLGFDDVCHEWQSNHQSDESAEDHMQPLLEAFETLKAMFDDDETAVEKIDRETEHVQEWVWEHMPDDSDERPERRLGEAPAADVLSGDRSIFDDVDALWAAPAFP